tara:strand:+ start:578 stop:1162 length:585 start_codon:yes stop_codon:yes gene_type:complete
MARILRRVSAPASLPITLTEVKAHLRVEHTDDDTYINSLIAAVVGFTDVQGALGRAMITQTWQQYVSPKPKTVTLLATPVQSVVSVKYYDIDGALQTDTLSNYDVFGSPDFTTIRPKKTKAWPDTQIRDDAIIIEYVIGYGSASDVPATTKHAMLMLVGHWYDNRENELIGTISKTLPYGFEELISIERGSWYG